MRVQSFRIRNRQGAIISKLILLCFREMRNAYAPDDKNIGRVLQQIMVAMTVRLVDERKRGPTTISAIARTTGLPRSNVTRAVKVLRRRHVLARVDGGYIRENSYLGHRIDPRYIRRIVAAVLRAAEEIRDPQKNI